MYKKGDIYAIEYLFSISKNKKDICFYHSSDEKGFFGSYYWQTKEILPLSLQKRLCSKAAIHQGRPLQPVWSLL